MQGNHSYPLGGPDYIRHHPWSAWPYLIIAGTASVVGTIGNLLILGSVYCYKRLKKSSNIFIVNLAISDLCVTTFMDPMGIIGLARGKPFFDDRPILCDIAATVCLGACVNSLLSIGGISFNRCIHICHTHIYRSISGLRTNICICICFWIIGFGISLPGFFGWTDNIYDHKMLECVWDRTRSLSYTIFFSSVAVFTPILIIASSYIKILTFVIASKKKVAKICQSQEYIDKSRAASLRVAKSLFIIFAIFVFCWAPYALLVLVDFQDQAPQEIHLYILLLAHLHATLNAIVYCITNKHFRIGYLMVCKKLIGQTVKITFSPSLRENSENIQAMGRAVCRVGDATVSKIVEQNVNKTVSKQEEQTNRSLGETHEKKHEKNIALENVELRIKYEGKTLHETMSKNGEGKVQQTVEDTAFGTFCDSTNAKKAKIAETTDDEVVEQRVDDSDTKTLNEEMNHSEAKVEQSVVETAALTVKDICLSILDEHDNIDEEHTADTDDVEENVSDTRRRVDGTINLTEAETVEKTEEIV